MGWLIAAVVCALIAIMPLGVKVFYDAAGLLVKLVIGPVSVKLFPGEKKDSKKKKEKNRKNAQKGQVKTERKTPKEKKGGSLRDFEGLIRQALAFLGDFRRKLVIRCLKMKLILAADDPSDLAVNYGRAWAALGNLFPLLERLFCIKKRELEVECDFCADQTTITACVDIVISLGRLLGLVFVYGIRFVVEFLKLKNLRKGGQ